MTEAEKERQAIVDWLKGLHWTHRDAEPAKRFADAIASGAHRSQ